MASFSNIFNFLFNGSKTASPYKEVGVTSTPTFGGYVQDREKNIKLAGQKKFEYYEDMLSNVAIVSSGVRFYMTLLAKPEWKSEPADESAEAEAIAELLDEILDDMQNTLSSVIRQAALYKFNGFAWLEVTAKKRNDGTIGIFSIEARPARTIERWDIDEQGNISGVAQRSAWDGTEKYIPASKSIYLVDNLLSDSPEGFGMFRAMSETASRLKELCVTEKISYDRNLQGMPVGRAPIAELNAAVERGDITKAQADTVIDGLKKMVSLVKKGEQTGIILDSKPYESVSDTARNNTSVPQWGLELLSAQTSGLADIDKAIQRLNLEIARIMGVEILLLGSSGSGSLALSKDKSEALMLAINATLKEIADQFNKQLIPFLARLNGWNEKLLPKLTPSEVSQRDVVELASTLRDLSTAGVTLMRGDEAVDEVFALLGLTPPEASELDVLAPATQSPANDLQRTQQ